MPTTPDVAGMPEAMHLLSRIVLLAATMGLAGCVPWECRTAQERR